MAATARIAAAVTPLRTYAAAQNPGLRDNQCDATAARTGRDGVRAFALLDGIGSSTAVRDWTRSAAARLASAAARTADAERALTRLYDRYAAEADRQDPYTSRYMPKAAAVVAVVGPGRLLTVAWCGDCRAYLLEDGIAKRLTDDHNLRRVYPPTATRPYGGNRNVLTSCLGSARTDEDVRNESGHPAIESATVRLTGPARLLLASDGAYEPHLDADHDLYTELDDDGLATTVRAFVDLAVQTSIQASTAVDPARPYADNATALLAAIPA